MLSLTGYPLPEAAGERHDALTGEEDVVTHQAAQRHRVDGAVELRQRVQDHRLQPPSTQYSTRRRISHPHVRFLDKSSAKRLERCSDGVEDQGAGKAFMGYACPERIITSVLDAVSRVNRLVSAQTANLI